MFLAQALTQTRALRSEGAANVAMSDASPRIGSNWKQPAPVRPAPVRRPILSRIILGSN